VKFLLVVVALLVVSEFSEAQYRARARVQMMLPNAGRYWGNHPELIRWIKTYGGQASDFKYGGDLINLSRLSESNVFLGASMGLLITGGSDTDLTSGYLDVYTGTPLYTGDWLQFNVYAHFTGVAYSVDHIIPSYAPPPPTNVYFVNGWAVGAGPSFQMQIDLGHCEASTFAIGVEYGVTFLDPNASWQFGYAVPSYNRRSHTKNTPIPGPDVDAVLSYLRFSFIVKFR
jgi:hypothetical protein